MQYFLSKSELKVLFHQFKQVLYFGSCNSIWGYTYQLQIKLTVYEFDPIAFTYRRKWYEFPTENPRRDNMILAHFHRGAAWVIEQSHILKSQRARKQLGIISTDLSPKLTLQCLVNYRVVITERVLPHIPTTSMIHYVPVLISQENMPSPLYHTLILLQQYSLC